MLNSGRFVCGLLLLILLSTRATAADAAGVQWLTDAQAALQQATASGRPVLIKFTASWCGPCRRMEAVTFHDPAVVQMVHRDFVPLLLDGDEHKDLAIQLKIRGFPALLIVAPDMTELKRIMGFQKPEELLPQLTETTMAYRKQVGAAQLAMAASARPRRTDVPAQTAGMAAPGSNSSVPAVRAVSAAHLRTPAFDGLCLPSVVSERALVRGTSDVRGEYRGHLLFFHTAKQKQAFFRDPEQYWPMLDGTCAMTLLKTGQARTGQLKHAAVFRDRIWLFASRELMQEFVATPAEFVGQLSTHLSERR